MEYIYPDYYREFRCIAGDCIDSCCETWQIVPDEKSIRKYKRYKGTFAGRLHNSIDYQNGVIRQYHGKCVFLNEEKLCDLYTEAGANLLCKTCRRYPRHYEEFENVREITLSISCPEVARILMNKKEKVSFLRREQDGLEENYREFDYLLYTKLLYERDCFYRILQNRRLSIEERMAFILTISHDLQRHALHEWDAFLRKCETEEFLHRGQKRFEEKRDFIGYAKSYKREGLFLNLFCMERLNSQWREQLSDAYRVLFDDVHTDTLEEQYKEFINWMKEEGRETEYEQLLIYYLSTYFLGSVYDGRSYDSVRFAISQVLLIRQLGFAMWLQNQKFTIEDQIQLVYRFSREIEHSDVNLAKFDYIIQKNDEFRLYNMLRSIFAC